MISFRSVLDNSQHLLSTTRKRSNAQGFRSAFSIFLIVVRRIVSSSWDRGLVICYELWAQQVTKFANTWIGHDWWRSTWASEFFRKSLEIEKALWLQRWVCHLIRSWSAVSPIRPRGFRSQCCVLLNSVVYLIYSSWSLIALVLDQLSAHLETSRVTTILIKRYLAFVRW